MPGLSLSCSSFQLIITSDCCLMTVMFKIHSQNFKQMVNCDQYHDRAKSHNSELREDLSSANQENANQLTKVEDLSQRNTALQTQVEGK